MKRILSVFVSGLIFCTPGACLGQEGNASATADEAHGLPLSDMRVKITSKGYTASFRLYDTVAAKEFYDQLPLMPDLSNFRDAQWMFYPPEKLRVRCIMKGKRAN